MRPIARACLVALMAMACGAVPCCAAGSAERRPAPRAAPSPRSAPLQANVAVFGDRFARALAAGLNEDAGAGIAVTTFADDDAGLTRPDFEAWRAALRERLKAAGSPVAAVMMLGADDRRALPDGGGTVEPDSARWADLYGRRAGAVADIFRDAGVPLIWVGLPSVRNPASSAAFVRLNGIVRDHVGLAGARFVDIWEAFSDEAGRYSPVGPDVDGQTATLRKADGVGFTRAGTRKLASFVEGDIKRLRAPGSGAAPQAGITIERSRDFDQALSVDIEAQVRRAAGLAPGGAAARPASVPSGPVAGPVLPLTAPPLAPDGQLVEARMQS